MTRPASSPDLLRVGQLAEATGKTVRALRFYEEMGLLRPTRRSKGGFRLYDPAVVHRVRWIERLQQLGFSLSEIQDFLAALRDKDTGPDAMQELRGFYARKLIETRAAPARLSELERELVESIGYLESCGVCEPETPRSACAACDTDEHGGAEVPPLVAAVREPA